LVWRGDACYTRAMHDTDRKDPATGKAVASGRPLIIGEVLFDCFDDGREVLGGAPFNVAWHLQAFGARPLLISRIGQDPHGDQILAAMQSWGMDCSGMQHDPSHPTGMVSITMQGQQHRFSILADQAYDYIDPAAALALPSLAQAGLWYSGSLIERAPQSRTTVAALRKLPCPHFMDVNLREPWWEQAQVHAMLKGLRWAKLNEDELRQLGFAGDSEIAARAMREHFGIELLILTLGEAGALLITEDELLRGRPVPVRRLVDTVGAGDAFSAVMLLGILRNWPMAQSLQRALAFAAAQCEVQGAIHEDRSVYEKFLSQWGAAA